MPNGGGWSLDGGISSSTRAMLGIVRFSVLFFRPAGMKEADRAGCYLFSTLLAFFIMEEAMRWPGGPGSVNRG